MKLTGILFIASMFQVHANGFSQTISLSEQNARLESVFKKIEKQSGFHFWYEGKVMKETKRISINIQKATLEEVLKQCFTNQPVTYVIIDKTIVVKQKALPMEIVNEMVAPVIPFINVTGLVSDESGQPLAGVSVMIKGTTRGTTTSAAGKFTLQANIGDILAFSMVGYKEQSFKVDGTESMVDIRLEPDVTNMNDMVVVGYSRQKRINLSGAVDGITAKQIENRPITSLGAGLQGLIPNLNITNASGRATDAAGLNIRGITSITGGSPYILVDNVPYTANELSLLNPNDIESVTVLKDAASAAIYVARASFGVILVTTKTAKTSKLNVNANVFYATKTLGKLPQTITDPYISYITKHEAAYPYYPQLFNDPVIRDYAKQRSEDPSLPAVVVNPNDPNAWVYMGSTDWMKEAFNKNSPSYNANVSMSKKNDEVAYVLSAEYMRNEGVIKNANEVYDRYNLRGRMDIKVLNWLTVGNSTTFSSSLYNAPTYANDDIGYFWEINRLNSWDVVFNPDGTYSSTGASTIGRVQKGGRTINQQNNFLTTFSLTANVVKNILDIKGDVTFRRNAGNTREYDIPVPYSTGPGQPTLYRGPSTTYIRIGNSDTKNNITNLYVDFHKTFAGKHSIQALAGYNQEYRYEHGSYSRRNNLINPNLPSQALATGSSDMGENMLDWAVRGYFYRLNYIYDDKYILEFNGRYDGTSRFPASDRWAFLPSASAAWVVSKEKFMRTLGEKVGLNLLKLRASYGILGNQDVGAYSYLVNMSSGTIGQILNGSTPLAIYAPSPVSASLTWEKVRTINVGVDMSWLKNRLDISFDKFTRYTEGMLTKGKTLPAVFGATEPRINAADLKTKGWELRVGWKDMVSISGSPFFYGIGFNLSDSRSFITKYDNPTNSLRDYYVGQELGEIWGLETEGFFQSQAELASHANQQYFVSDDAGGTFGVGDLKWKDQNKDGFVNAGNGTLDNHGDLIRIGNSSQRYRFGADINLGWKGFDIRAFFQGVGKQDFYPRNNNVYFWSIFAQPWTNASVQAMDRWTTTNPNGYFPRLKSYIAEDVSELGFPQTRYLQNFSYIRLKNLTIGYSLPAAVIKKIGVNKIRFYFSGENLFDKSGVKFNLDPEALNGNVYPFQKTYSFGLNVTL